MPQGQGGGHGGQGGHGAATGDAEPHQLGHFVPRDFPAPVRALAAVSRAFAVLEGIGIGISLVALILLASYQVLSRNMRMHHQLWMPPSPEWTDSLLRHSVFILGFLGAAYATFTGRHIRVDAITRLVSWRPRLWMRVLTTLAAIAVCLVMASTAGALTLWRDLRHVAQPEMPDTFLAICRMEAGEASQAGEVFTSERGAMLIIAGFTLIAFHFLVQLLIDSVYVLRKGEPPGFWITEAGHGEMPPTSNQEMMSPPLVAPIIEPIGEPVVEPRIGPTIAPVVSGPTDDDAPRKPGGGAK